MLPAQFTYGNQTIEYTIHSAEFSGYSRLKMELQVMFQIRDNYQVFAIQDQADTTFSVIEIDKIDSYSTISGKKFNLLLKKITETPKQIFERASVNENMRDIENSTPIFNILDSDSFMNLGSIQIEESPQ